MVNILENNVEYLNPIFRYSITINDFTNIFDYFDVFEWCDKIYQNEWSHGFLKNTITFYFKSNEDVMMFKLRWL